MDKKQVFIGIVNIIGMIIVISFILTIVNLYRNVEEPKTIETQEMVFVVDCSSDSMGLTLNCNDELTSKLLKVNESLTLGNIYTYNGTNFFKEDGLVTHRLIFDLGDGTLIFKGDNNRIGERINRSDVLYSVLKVTYK